MFWGFFAASGMGNLESRAVHKAVQNLSNLRDFEQFALGDQAKLPVGKCK